MGLLLAGGLFRASPATAQPVVEPFQFGSAGDLAEQLQSVWWQRESRLYLLGGVSLIAAQWRGAAQTRLELVTRPVTARLSGTVRAGYYGEYGEDADEWYDALRLVDFARYNAPPDVPLHARVGVIRNMRLGTGHLVNFFSSATAWDERTVGIEAAAAWPLAEVAVFTDNVLLDGVTGGRVRLNPFVRATSPLVRSLTLGGNVVTDLARRLAGVPRLTAYNVDAAVDLFTWGSVRLSPFGSYAWYPRFGSGVGLGADLHSDNFVDLLRFRVRLALFFSGDGFTPGYVGSFYTVSGSGARIVRSTAGGDAAADGSSVGLSLGAVRGGTDLVSEVRVLVFERFELWYYFQRHYGTQRLSTYHLRLFVRTTDRFRLDVGMARTGLGGFLTLFNDMDDQSALHFGWERALGPQLWLYARARYSYERLADARDGAERYLVQRRFEPLVGARLTF